MKAAIRGSHFRKVGPKFAAGWRRLGPAFGPLHFHWLESEVDAGQWLPPTGTGASGATRTRAAQAAGWRASSRGRWRPLDQLASRARERRLPS